MYYNDDSEGNVKHYYGNNAVEDLCEQLFFTSKYQGYTVLSHNGRGYNMQPIAKFLYDYNLHPDIMLSGKKIIQLNAKTLNITFRDANSILNSSLKNWQKHIL